MKEIKWEKLTRRGKNVSILLISSVIRTYLQNLTYKKFGLSTPKDYRQLDGGRWFAADYIHKIVGELKQTYLNNPKKLLKIVQQYQIDIVDTRKWTKKYKNKSLIKFTNNDIVSLWEEFFRKSDNIFSIVYGYIFINKFLPDVLVETLEKRKLDDQKKSQYLNKLLSLDRSSGLKKEKLSLLRIVGAIKDNKIRKGSGKFHEMIDQHLKKYEYLGQYFYKRKPYSRRDIIKRINFFLKSDFRGEIKGLSKQNLNKYYSEKIMKELNFTKKEVMLVNILKGFAYSANSFDEDYTAAICNFSSIIKESAKRLRVKIECIKAMTCNELLLSLKKGAIDKKFHNELLARLENDAIIMTNGTETVLSGKKLDEYSKREVKEEKEQTDIQVVKGQSAQPGLVRGIVHLVFNVDEVSKVKKGEILVSPATMPSHVPAMEKASAIVTDEGGLLSHAAIVSRELGVPCIVGTRIGTKVFKNGDLIEVDASKGIIKKL